MKTNVALTSIDAFYGRVVPKLAASQNERVMKVIQPGRDYSLSELMALVHGIDKSSMSRVVNGLRAANRLQPAPERKCTVTGVTITPSRLPARPVPRPVQTSFDLE
jgi:hypothetical protein